MFTQSSRESCEVGTIYYPHFTDEEAEALSLTQLVSVAPGAVLFLGPIDGSEVSPHGFSPLTDMEGCGRGLWRQLIPDEAITASEGACGVFPPTVSSSLSSVRTAHASSHLQEMLVSSISGFSLIT